MRPSFMRPALVAYNGYDSGLGNRVRVVLGAASLAALEGRDLYYVWPTGSLFGPKFGDLWDFRGRTVPRAVSRLLAYQWPYEDHTLTWINDERRKDLLWQIRTGSPLDLHEEAVPWEQTLRSLHPVPAVEHRITSFFDQHLRGRHYVGVMIRAHQVSHPRTQQASPVEWYVERLTQIAHQFPGMTFFISCDVQEVQDRITRMIPNCVGQSDKGAYNSVAGVQASVADLYLLASASYLVGPYFSSFVHLAEHLAGGRLFMETSNSGHVDLESRIIPELTPDPRRPFDR